jgi:hypothetical protein
MAMATAVTMQPSPIRPNPVPIAPARSQNKIQARSRETLIRPKPMSSDGNSNTGIVVGGKDRPCDACRKRKSRCAMNEATKKCYSCDFHRQDCTFSDTPPPRKKRTDTSINPINPSEVDAKYVHNPDWLDGLANWLQQCSANPKIVQLLIQCLVKWISAASHSIQQHIGLVDPLHKPRPASVISIESAHWQDYGDRATTFRPSPVGPQ